MGYTTTEYLELIKKWVERSAEALEKAYQEAKEAYEKGDRLGAYLRVSAAADVQAHALKTTTELIGEEIAATNQPYVSEVDVYLDGKILKGKLHWGYLVESREWGIKSFTTHLIKLELEEREPPEWFKNGDFLELPWEVDVHESFQLDRDAKGALQITPSDVFIYEGQKKAIHVYFRML